jgi:hypothetical protein
MKIHRKKFRADFDERKFIGKKFALILPNENSSEKIRGDCVERKFIEKKILR